MSDSHVRFLGTEKEGLLNSANSFVSAGKSMGSEGRVSVMRLLYPHEPKQAENKRKSVEQRKHSWLFSMLNPSSVKPQAELFKTFISTCIVVSVASFIIGTSPHAAGYDLVFYLIEGITSGIFLMEYLVRFYVITESRAYRHPVRGRLRYALTLPSLIDLVSFLPFFLEVIVQGIDGPFLHHGSSRVLPNLEPLRALRIVRILKTRKVAQAVKVLYHVLSHNSEVLLVAIVLCGGLLLFQSTFLYYFRPPSGSGYDNGDFESIPAAMYSSVLMITTLQAPTGDYPWYTKVLLAMNALMSVAMLAIPTSMLTWGFEAEAQRVAVRLERKAATSVSPGLVEWEGVHPGADAASCSSSDSSSDSSEGVPAVINHTSGVRPGESLYSVSSNPRDTAHEDPHTYKLILEELRSQRQELIKITRELTNLQSSKTVRDACVSTDSS